MVVGLQLLRVHTFRVDVSGGVGNGKFTTLSMFRACMVSTTEQEHITTEQTPTTRPDKAMQGLATHKVCLSIHLHLQQQVICWSPGHLRRRELLKLILEDSRRVETVAVAWLCPASPPCSLVGRCLGCPLHPTWHRQSVRRYGCLGKHRHQSYLNCDIPVTLS